MAQIWQYPSSVPPSSGGAHNTVRRVYVDNLYGNDLTAQVDNQHRPFRSLQAAIDALGSVYPSFGEVVVYSQFSGPLMNYTYSDTYRFSTLYFIFYHTTACNLTDLPTNGLFITVFGRGTNISINQINTNLRVINIHAVNRVNNLSIQQPNLDDVNIIYISGKYSNITLNNNHVVSDYYSFWVTIYNAHIGYLNYQRAGERVGDESFSVVNSYIGGVNILYDNINDGTGVGTPVNWFFQDSVIGRDPDHPTEASLSLVNILLDNPNIGPFGIYSQHVVKIDNCSFNFIERFWVYGSARAANSRFSAFDYTSMIYCYAPSDVTNVSPVFFEQCVFGGKGYYFSPLFVMDVPDYQFSYCKFYRDSTYDSTSGLDHSSFLIWDVCSSTLTDRVIKFEYCHFETNTAAVDNMHGIIHVRGTENSYSVSQRYIFKYCNVINGQFVNNFIVFDEKSIYAPYNLLSSLYFNPITSFGSNGSYDVSIYYSNINIQQNVVVYAVQTLNRLYVRDYYNVYRRIGTGMIHSLSASTDLYIFHTESNGLYMGVPLYGDSKQVVRTWNSGALGVSADDKTHVLLPGFTGPVFLTNAVNFVDYKEVTIINNSGIPIVVNAAFGESIDGFSSITLGVNQRITLKRISNTEFATI